MIRALTALILTLVSAALGALWVFGLDRPVGTPWLGGGDNWVRLSIDGDRLLFDHWSRTDWKNTPPPPMDFAGVHIEQFRYTVSDAAGVLNRTRAVRVAVPLWLAAVLFAGIYPLVTLGYRPIRRLVRRAKNRCVGCGYPLTGLPDPRCPECGRAYKLKA